MQNVYFESTGFRDTEEIANSHTNGIEGYSLAQMLKAGLEEQGCQCEEIIDDEDGWVFYASRARKRYLCSVSVTQMADTSDPENAARAPDGTLMHINIDIDKHRSLLAELIGRNKMLCDDPVLRAVRDLLESHKDCRELKGSCD